MAFVVTVLFEIAADRFAAFLPLMQTNASTSVRDEVGCLQFDVCTDDASPDQVFLYEVYIDRAAFDAHLQSPHFKSFDAATADMIRAKTVRTFDGHHANHT